MTDARSDFRLMTWLSLSILCVVGGATVGNAFIAQSNAAEDSDLTSATKSDQPSQTLEEAKLAGAIRSRYRNETPRTKNSTAPAANLKVFHEIVEPILGQTCVSCHGPETQEGNIRIDTLDPDLLHGGDVDWWLEVLAVLSNGEMPPADESELADADRSEVIDWLSTEIQIASAVRRAEHGHSSFRRMTR